MIRFNHKRAATMLLAAAGFVAACADDPMMPGSEPTVLATTGDGLFPHDISVCKDGPAGTYNFTVGVTGGSTYDVPSGASFSLVPGQCVVVFVSTAPSTTTSDPLATVTVTELGTSALDSIKVAAEFGGPSVLTGTRVSTMQGNRYHGGVITYFNAFPPPPPSVQGCSPGYWKNHTSAGKWPTPYTPSQAFSSVFANAFPGKTLLQVLGQGGGGLNALGRQTVSALLNAQALGSANYGMTAAAVIAAFNSAYASGTYGPLTAQLEGMTDINGRICPLN